MRIHTFMTEAELADALGRARREAGVYTLKQKGYASRSHRLAFEILLSGDSPYSTNSGRYGASNEGQAAAWDQWGIFLAVMFEADPMIKVTGAYRNAAHFHHVTGGRFSRDHVGTEVVRSQESAAYRRTAHRWQYDHENSNPLTGPVVNKCVNGQHTAADGTLCTAKFIP